MAFSFHLVNFIHNFVRQTIVDNRIFIPARDLF